jgi:dihydrofolate reductase
VIRLIAAIDRKRGVATDAGIPWSIAKDVTHFHDETSTGLILMGWNTYSEFAQPLHHRLNFVITSTSSLRTGFKAVTSLDRLRSEHPCEDIWVIGGASVFANCIEQADELHITQIDGDFHCTKFFPDFGANFQLRTEGDAQEENGVSFRFETWEPRRLSKPSIRNGHDLAANGATQI